MFRARLGFALVVTTQRPVVVGTISQACVMSPVFSHVVTRVPDTGGFPIGSGSNYRYENNDRVGCLFLQYHSM